MIFERNKQLLVWERCWAKWTCLCFFAFSFVDVNYFHHLYLSHRNEMNSRIQPIWKTIWIFDKTLIIIHIYFSNESEGFLNWNADIDGANHPLRPELHETTYFLNAVLKDFSAVVSNSPGNDSAFSSGWLWSADFSIHAIGELTRTECGTAWSEQYWRNQRTLHMIQKTWMMRCHPSFSMKL